MREDEHLRESQNQQGGLAAEDALVIFAKYPEPGQVKTRLGKMIGDARAAALYRAFLGDLAVRFGRMATGRNTYSVWWACQPGMRPLSEIVGEDAGCFDQRGETLDLRLWNVCSDLQAQGYRRLVIVGSDAPHLPASLVREAFTLLDTHDIALGPAEDGGYYLIGLHLTQEPPDLFRGIQMSTATVFAETLQRTQSLGLEVALLSTLFDIDEAADLPRLAALLDAGIYNAPQTQDALRRLNLVRRWS